MPSVCNKPVTGSHALGSPQRLERCCLWWAALPSHGIGSAEVTLILLLLVMVDSDDSNVVTLLIQLPSMQSRSGDNMIRPYSWILHGVRTRYGQMAEVNLYILTCIHVMHRPTDHQWFRKKRQRRICCLVLLCSSPSPRDLGVVTFSPQVKMGYCSSPIQRDDYSVVISSWRLLVAGAWT